jgi:hypothetical protein
MTENQQRFLKAIAERIPSGRVAEVRLFPAIRQGHMESAVAVVALESAPNDAEREVPLASIPGDFEGRTEGRPVVALDPGPSSGLDSPSVRDTPPREPRSDVGTNLAFGTDASPRHVILTARYALTVKGPDRGKWDFEVVHDADAPLNTVERVARGMAHRVGEDGEPELFSAAEFHRAVTEPWWSK